MRAISIIAAVWSCGLATAHADYSSEWRDGCPPGNLEQATDHLAFSRARPQEDSTAPIKPYSTDPQTMGTAPQVDSALIPTRLLLFGEYFNFSAGSQDHGGPGIGRARQFGGAVQAHLNGPLPFSWGASWGARFGMTVMTARGDQFAGDSTGMAPSAWGNVVIAPAIRWSWLGSYLHHKPGPGGPITDTEGDVAALRFGIAVQALYTLSPTASDPANSFALMKRSAFESYLYSPYRTIGGSFEYRSEGVGCYSPFFHLHLSALVTRDHVGRGMAIFPETVAAGLSVASNTSVYFQYGLVAVAGAQTQEQDPVFGADIIHRFRFGVDWTFASWSIGSHVEEFIGSAAYNGAVFGLDLSLKSTPSGDWQ